jgi:hypothetical protein
MGVSILASPAAGDHDDVAAPDEIVTVNGIRVLADLDLNNLRVCANCGYEIVDQPQYETTMQALSRYGNNELVIGVSYNGVEKAYPLAALQPVRFHVANDDFNGTPITVSFCPICFSAVVFEGPVINGQVAQFATAGLYNNDLVMYDDVTFTLYQQFTGEPMVGPMVGEIGLIHRVPADIIPLGTWADAHPNSVIYIDPTLSQPRNSRSVIQGLIPYEAIAGGGGRSEVDADTRLNDRDIVVGVVINGVSKAYLEDSLLEAELINDVVGDSPVLVFVDPVSTEIRFFQSVISTGSLTFRFQGDGLIDDETSSRWDFEGFATNGPLAGTQLVEEAGLPSYWFAWVSFHPETELYK